MFSEVLQFLLNQQGVEKLIISVPIIAISEFGLPIPVFLESILLFAGFKISQGHISYALTGLFTLIGSIIGASLLYFLSIFFGDKILSHYKYFQERRQKIEATLAKYSSWEVFMIGLLRLTPALVPTTLAAGILEISYWKFLTGVAISGLVYNLVFITLGIFLGKNAPVIAANRSLFFKIAFPLIIIPILLILAARLVKFNWKNKKISN